MKVQTLLEYTFPQIRYRHVARLPRAYHHYAADSNPRYKNEVPSPLMRKGVKHLGTGSFASAYSSPRIPHDVRKVSRSLANELPKSGFNDVDGFYYYMLALSKSSDNDNPYFPRFRSITVYTNDQGQIVYSAQVERLWTYYDLLPEEKESIKDRLYGREESKNKHGTPLWIVLHAIRDPDAEDVKSIIDDDFKRATKFIHDLSIDLHIGYDIHADNLMFRRGPGGPHLVINDPLSY